MNNPPIFYDPSSRRWNWFKRILILLIVLGMVLLCTLMVNILTFPALGSPGNLLPQTITHTGPEIAHPGDLTNGNLQLQLQQAVTTLNAALPTATVLMTERPTLVPANPLATQAAPTRISTISAVNSTPTQNGLFPSATPVPISTATAAPTSPRPTQARATLPSPTSPSQPTPTRGRKPTAAPTSSTPVPSATPHPKGKTPTPAALLLPGSFPASQQVVSNPNTSRLFINIPHLVSKVQVALVDDHSSQADASYHPIRIGFYVDWDENGDTSLQQNIQKLDIFMPVWLHLADANGIVADDNLAKENQILSLIQQKRADLPIMPMINTYDSRAGQWNTQLLKQMLGNPSRRYQTIQNLLNYVQRNHMAGVSIDFEDAPPESQSDLQAFMQELYANLHSLGLEVSMAIPLADDTFDARAYAPYCDYLILVSYEEHWSGGKPGPIASKAWYQSGLQRRLSLVDPNKVVVAIGNYGYDWTADAPPGEAVTFQEAVQSASEAKASVVFDPASSNPTFTYTDSGGQRHTVWYLDAATAYNQVIEGMRQKVRGFALWRLGSEDPSIWQVLGRLPTLDAQTVKGLETQDFGLAINYEGEGEVLKIVGLPQQGSRALTLDSETGLISSEKILSFPSTYTIMRWGRKDKQVALNFDDGPDAIYTSQVLDVLKKYHVPATFFIVGAQGEQHPELLHRIVDEGHEIGVHTFTHPDISTISPEQLRLELNATQLLLESQLGVGTILFRAPYNIDAEPKSPAEVKPLVEISQLGYYTIGMQIDPGDWRRPGVQAIVSETLNQLSTGEGNIIVLHDGGGDRSQTVKALPAIIETLQASGFRFIPVSDLMGLKKDQVMPPVATGRNLQKEIGLLGFTIAGLTTNLSSVLFLVCAILGIVRMVFISILAVVQWFRADRREAKDDYRPPVSVLVPAYNEAKVINKTVHSLLQSTYLNLEIVVIDDGSADDTFGCVMAEFPYEPRLHAYRKENGGKSDALNYGILHSTGEIIVVLDADTIILPNAIERLVRHMSNPRVCAVAGNAKVGNRTNLLTRMQALEYITSQNMDRRAFALLNCITVVPGAIGAWRREQVMKVGGFKTDTLAEDADLTLNILRTGIHIEYEEGAIALTEAPENLRSFLKQRFRWMFGMLQTTWKQKDAIFHPKFGAMGLVALPNILIFSILLPLISPILDLSFIWSLINWGIYRFQHPADPNLQLLIPVLEFYVFFLLIDFLSTLLAFIMESREDWKLIWLLFLQRFFYRQLMYYTAIKSALAALHGQAVGWNKLERKATVKF